MRSVFHAFDIKAADIVAKIPAPFKQPLVWLGRFTTPILWACYLTIIHTVLLTPGRLEGKGLLLVILLPLASLLKLFFKRTRPPTIYAQAMKIKSYSFPSSHAYAGWLSSAYLAVVAFAHNLELLGVVLIGFGLFIGISRVRIGAHYPTDVVAAWILSSAVLSVFLAT